MRVTVMGLGLFGGALATVRFFAERGDAVTVTDLKQEKDLRSSLDQLAGLPLKLVLGEHCEDDFIDTDLVIANPAVLPDNPLLALATRQGIPVETELGVFVAHNPAPWIGITGSAGKTTTTAMTHAVLKTGPRRVWLGGNIGGSLLPQLPEIRPADLVVLEISSFQLFRMRTLKGLCGAALTNLSPNHLDWHGSLDGYFGAKMRLLGAVPPGGFCLLNHDDPATRKAVAGYPPQARWLSRCEAVPRGYSWQGREIWRARDGEKILVGVLDDLAIPGDFNRANALMALAIASEMGIPGEQATRVLREFPGVPHRLERVRIVKGVTLYNDSKATTPAALGAALDTLKGSIILIAGGYDKGLLLEEIGRKIAARCKAVVLLGANREKMALAIPAPCQVIKTENLEQALPQAFALARPGDNVLFSPGTSSYDQYANFEARGEHFKGLAAKL